MNVRIAFKYDFSLIIIVTMFSNKKRKEKEMCSDKEKKIIKRK